MFYSCINFTEHKHKKGVNSYAVNALDLLKCVYAIMNSKL